MVPIGPFSTISTLQLLAVASSWAGSELIPSRCSTSFAACQQATFLADRDLLRNLTDDPPHTLPMRK
jgi:hypothetical protein